MLFTSASDTMPFTFDTNNPFAVSLATSLATSLAEVWALVCLCSALMLKALSKPLPKQVDSGKYLAPAFGISLDSKWSQEEGDRFDHGDFSELPAIAFPPQPRPQSRTRGLRGEDSYALFSQYMYRKRDRETTDDGVAGNT